jgi:Glyceraldehyde 3-phosphate dehydrogenase, NAD binding domain
MGRIGRLALGGLYRPADDPRARNRLDVVHVNELKGGAATTAHLLEFDSIHGRWRESFGFEGCLVHTARRPDALASAAQSRARRPAGILHQFGSRGTGGHRQTIGFAHPADIEQRSLEVHDLFRHLQIATAQSHFASNAAQIPGPHETQHHHVRGGHPTDFGCGVIASSKLDFFMSRCVRRRLRNRYGNRRGGVRHQHRINRHPDGQSTKECQRDPPRHRR